MTDSNDITSARLQRAADQINAVPVGADWAYWATEARRWYTVDSDGLEALCDHLDAQDDEHDAYEAWVCNTACVEMPEGWAPDSNDITLRAAIDQVTDDWTDHVWRTDRGNGSAGPMLVELPEDERVTAVAESEDPDAWERARLCQPSHSVAAVYVSDPDGAESSAYQAIWVVLGEALSTADRIAARFGGDGQCWRHQVDADGGILSDVCSAENGVSIEQDWGREATRYNFPDGSALIECGGGWDLAIPESHEQCMCWVGADHGRHDERCEHGAD